MQKFIIYKLILPALLTIALSANCYAQTMELPLPNVPKELRQPKERAAFILEHFWDGMEFCDTLRSRNRGFMEQNFANYLSLFPHAEQSALPTFVNKLMKAASVDKKAFMMVGEIAEQYLGEKQSPVYNEGYFILFLEAQINSGILSENELLRPTFLLNTAKKNRPGMVAANFSYKTSKGISANLHTTEAENLLLMFYAPDCEHCMEVVKDMQKNVQLRELLKSKRLKVLAVYADGDRQLWKRTKDNLPKEWTSALDIDGIFRKNLYALPSLPVMYLLDKNKKVLLKESNVEEIISFYTNETVE